MNRMTDQTERRTPNKTLFRNLTNLAGSPVYGEPAFALKEAAVGFALLVNTLVHDEAARGEALRRIEEALLHATRTYREQEETT